MATAAAAQPVCVSDYETKALTLLGKPTADYYAGGADEEQTLRENVSDYSRLRLRPRMLVDVSTIKLSTTILGKRINFPVCVAPTSFHKLAHHRGELATGKGAEALGTCMCMSTIANYSVDELSESAPALLKWFQLYVYRDKELSEMVVKRAENAGCKALVITLDHPEIGYRRRNVKSGYVLPVRPPYISFKNLEGLMSDLDLKADDIDNTLTWEDIAWLTSITSLPVIAKGILTGDDAKRAIEAGCSAVYVSNHGGRQLDGVYSTITALPEVVEAVRGRVEVYVDGGVRKGTDVLKALALGARAVFIGRPILYGLAVAGEEGVKGVLTILRNELKLAMQLSGVTDVEKIPKDLVVHESAISKL